MDSLSPSPRKGPWSKVIAKFSPSLCNMRVGVHLSLQTILQEMATGIKTTEGHCKWQCLGLLSLKLTVIMISAKLYHNAPVTSSALFDLIISELNNWLCLSLGEFSCTCP